MGNEDLKSTSISPNKMFEQSSHPESEVPIDKDLSSSGNSNAADGAVVGGVSETPNAIAAEPASIGSDQETTQGQTRAAVKIQSVYRGHKTRRELKGMRLTAEERWMDAIGEALYRTKVRPLSREERNKLLALKCESGDTRRQLSSSRDRWERVGYLARMVQHDDPETEDPSDTDTEKQKLKEKKQKMKQEAIKHAKAMDAQYFLELVDLKHRYGANLKVYHDYWKGLPTDENFFYWLDSGSGRDVDLSTCPKEQLDRERVKYLSREERQAYLVRIVQGRLCWAKDGKRIDTSEIYKNSNHGIVKRDELDARDSRPRSSSSSTSSSSSSSSSSSTDSTQGNHYANHGSGKKSTFHFSPTYILNRLLQKTTKRNTWIFVADTSFRLYVGIKQSGAFQHSSFLHGARVSAAGLIKIKDGKLKSLSPLSGHYRPPASNFKEFLKSLKEAGVDMSSVRISKSYAVLIGLETCSKIKKEQQKAKEKFHEHHPHLSSLHCGKRDTSPSSAGNTTADDITKKRKERRFINKRKEKKESQEGGKADATKANANEKPHDRLPFEPLAGLPASVEQPLQAPINTTSA